MPNWMPRITLKVRDKGTRKKANLERVQQAAQECVNLIESNLSEREIAERRVSEATNTLRAEYYEDVRDTAQSIKDELKERLEAGEGGEPLREWLIEHIHETIDGSGRVIYTWQAQLCVLFSDNDGAYVDNFGPEGMVEDGQINWSRLAYAAFEQDVMEQLEAEGIDVNKPDSDESKEACGLEVESE